MRVVRSVRVVTSVGGEGGSTCAIDCCSCTILATSSILTSLNMSLTESPLVNWSATADNEGAGQ